jgi:hypothetical protein
MYYKEFLRVRNLFIAFAVVLTLVALVILLFTMHGSVTVDLASAASAPHSHAVAAHSTPAAKNSIVGPGIEVTDTAHVPFAVLFAIAGFVAAIFATCLGTSLACENSGHLEVAWTRPASRVGYALRLMLVDAFGIGAMYLFTILLSLAVIFIRGWQGYMVSDSLGWLVLSRFVLYPLAWYGLVIALSASVRGKAGAIAGFSWLGAGLLVVLLSANLPPAIHAIVVFLNYFNPVLYGSYSQTGETARHVMTLTGVEPVVGLSAITLLGTAAGLVQWRRLEA